MTEDQMKKTIAGAREDVQAALEKLSQVVVDGAPGLAGKVDAHILHGYNEAFDDLRKVRSKLGGGA